MLGQRKLVFTALEDDDYPIPIDKTSCALLGPTALVVQGLMGVFVVLSLVYKRNRESEKRPWRIWMYDVSKQVVGQAFVHSLNVLISDVGADHSSRGSNACVFYFFNILIDTTFGVAIIYGLLNLAKYLLVQKLQLPGFESGQYNTPPRFSYWARQAAVYVAVLTTMKLVVVGVFAAWPGIIQVGEWLLSWTGTNENLQVVFVMGFFPIVMNVIQFWIIDSIVKAATITNTVPSLAPEDEEEQSPFINDSRDSPEPEDYEREDLESGATKKGTSSTPSEHKSIASTSTS